jgi:hypothetical protein
MSDFKLKTPVVLIIFNRPDTTIRVFAEIAKARPPKLLVIADGPRADHPDDAEKCTAVRAILDGVDWDCEVLKNYSDVNLGCKCRVSSGLDWVFDTVEEAIILEDDCLPHPTFFRFCEEMLERYQDDKRVMHISGTNIPTKNLKSNTYRFSKHMGVWGWATWKRAWDLYDSSIEFWPAIRKSGFFSMRYNEINGGTYRQIYDDVYNDKIDTWDHQWQLCVSLYGLAIFPCVNLILNCGFGESATHTTNKRDHRANLKFGELVFPLKHPAYYIIDEIDRKSNKHSIINIIKYWFFLIKRYLNQIKSKICRIY